MAGRGQEETARLRQNVEEQLSRLLEQLEDLETYKGELDADEWQEMKDETLEALQEMKQNLAKMLSGNMTLVSELGALQLVRPSPRSPLFPWPRPPRARPRFLSLSERPALVM